MNIIVINPNGQVVNCGVMNGRAVYIDSAECAGMTYEGFTSMVDIGTVGLFTNVSWTDSRMVQENLLKMAHMVHENNAVIHNWSDIEKAFSKPITLSSQRGLSVGPLATFDDILQYPFGNAMHDAAFQTKEFGLVKDVDWFVPEGFKFRPMLDSSEIATLNAALCKEGIGDLCINDTNATNRSAVFKAFDILSMCSEPEDRPALETQKEAANRRYLEDITRQHGADGFAKVKSDSIVIQLI